MFCVEHSTFNRGNTEYTSACHAVLENLIFPCLAAFQVFSHRANQVYLCLRTQAIPWLCCALWKQCHLLLCVKQKIAGVSEVQLLILLRGMRRSELVMPLQGMWLYSSGFVCKIGYDSACLICVSKFLINVNILQGKV